MMIDKEEELKFNQKMVDQKTLLIEMIKKGLETMVVGLNAEAICKYAEAAQDGINQLESSIVYYTDKIQALNEDNE